LKGDDVVLVKHPVLYPHQWLSAMNTHDVDLFNDVVGFARVKDLDEDVCTCKYMYLAYA